MPYATELAQELTFMTPDINLGERANAACANLSANGFVVATGLTRQYVLHAADIAAEAKVREYHPKDLNERLATASAASRWHTGGKALVGLFNIGFDAADAGPDDLRLLEKRDYLEQVGYGWLSKRPDGSTAVTTRIGELGIWHAEERATGSQAGPINLGLSLGEAVLGIGAHIEGDDPHHMTYDYWESDADSAALVKDLGFTPQYRSTISRQTLKPVGHAFPSGSVVYPGMHNGKLKRMVEDVRITSQLTTHPLLGA